MKKSESEVVNLRLAGRGQGDIHIRHFGQALPGQEAGN
jgi:hypothetical protein